MEPNNDRNPFVSHYLSVAIEAEARRERSRVFWAALARISVFARALARTVAQQARRLRLRTPSLG